MHYSEQPSLRKSQKLALNHITNIRSFLLAVMALCSSILARAQDTIQDKEVEQRIENIAESLENEDIDYTTLLDELEQYRRNPLNLNTATRDELEALLILDDVQINNLLQHIKKNGKLIAIYELQSIDGFDLVRVSGDLTTAHFTVKEMFKHGQHQVLMRYQQVLEDQKGFLPASDSLLQASPNSRYLGSKHKLYTRYRFTYGTHVSWGLTAEKDAGEEFFRGTQKQGFDFYSAHLFLRNIRFVKALAIGDYQVEFGQGLTAWSGLAFGKTSDGLNSKRNARGLRPYASVDENLFMRGAAATVGYKGLEATGFVSMKKIDANVSEQDTLTDETLTVSSLQETGYHSTPGEMADRHVLDQTVFGGNIGYKRRTFTFGITGIHTEYGAALQRNLQLYNQFEFSARSQSTIGADYSFLYRNFNFFGEVSLTDNGGYAYLNGVLVSLDPRLAISILHRNYQRNFQSLFSNAFGENTRAANEKGIYAGIVARPASHISITAYYDRFVFPWLRYLVDAPSHGSDYSVQLNYTPNKRFDLYMRIRQRDKFRNTSEDDDIDYIVPVAQTNYRLNLNFSATSAIKLRNRLEVIDYITDSKNERGYLIYQDVLYRQMGKPLTLAFRYALFQTPSYDSRIYAYETDVPGSFSILSHYSRGSRTYVTLSYDINRHIEVWLRWSQTYYSDRDVISEGSLTEIQGNTKSEVKAQLRLKF
jgi:hypothetical protein